MPNRNQIRATRFKQWLPEWEDLKFEASEHRRRPEPFLYLFSMPASHLRALSGVFRRQRDGGIATGIQRGHDKDRSAQIRDFVRFGYPYSEMSTSRRSSFNSDDLRKPGWLPTAIVVNILTENDIRRDRRVANSDRILIEDSKDIATLQLPEGFTGPEWEAKELAPIEIIDGQHRLYAFDAEMSDDFELPVVAYKGLDIGWQAYLFWSINVSPKKINPSHAFDLYPLLRSQDWLEKFAESNVYREARAQELTEFLFRHSESPWHNRINMLGERGQRGVSQAGWIRALAGTFLAAGRGKGTKGLFGCSISDITGPLPWTRPQQAALLIYLWQECANAVRSSHEPWAEALRQPNKNQSTLGLVETTDLAFAGPTSMLAQEQGVRGLLSVSNDLLFSQATELELANWETDEDLGSNTDDAEISEALQSVRKQPFTSFIKELASALATYDWRSAEAPGLAEDEKLKKRAFRGSGGYAALRDELLKLLASGSGQVAEAAKSVRHSRQ